MDSEQFAFILGFQPSLYGGLCYVEFGVQPKALDHIHGEKVDLTKIKYYECEFRMRLRNEDNSDQWLYSDDPETNVQKANRIGDAIAIMTTDTRLAWVLVKIYEKRDLRKAKQFATVALYKLGGGGSFSGRSDFESVLAASE